MPDETLLLKQLTEGEAAKAVLENPVFRRVAEDLRKECFKAFKGSDDDKAMEARREIRVFETFLTKFIVTQRKGEEAAKVLETLKERNKEGKRIDANALGGIA